MAGRARKPTNKKESTLPEGVYGGEVNGANPLEWNLRSTICSQLRNAGYHCSMDMFNDKSSSWISVYSREHDPRNPKAGKVMSISIEFNAEGSILIGITVFEEMFSLTSGGTNCIFK